MKFYKLLNLKRQSAGPFTTTEKGYTEMKKSPTMSKFITLIGECDEFGNLLGDVKKGNFVKTPETENLISKESLSKLVIEKIDPVFADDFKDGKLIQSDFQTFDEHGEPGETLPEGGDTKKETGTEDSITDRGTGAASHIEPNDAGTGKPAKRKPGPRPKPKDGSNL